MVMTNSSTLDYILGDIAKYLWVICSPIIFIVGCVANTLAIIVLYRIQKKRSSVGGVYRIVLAVSDMIILCTGLSRYWFLNLIEDFDIREFTNAGCKIYLFVIYVSMQYSSWVLVSLTVQRCLIVYSPLKFRTIWTSRVSWIQLSILFIFLSMLNGHYFVSNALSANGSCNSTSAGFYDFEENYVVYIDLSFLCLIPFLIMLLGNLYFLKNMRSVREMRRSMTEGQRNQQQPRTQNTTLVMKMTWLFLFTTLPICIYMIYDSHAKSGPNMDLAKAVCYLIQYCGVSFNICIYIKNDRRFKQQIEILFNLKHIFGRSDTTSSQRNTQSSEFNTSNRNYSRKGSRNYSITSSRNCSITGAPLVSAANKEKKFNKMDSLKEIPTTNKTRDAGDEFISTHM